MPSPYLTRLQHVAVKVESVEGVDESPADADVIAPAFDIEYEPTFEVPERNPHSASFDKPTAVSGQQSAIIRFSTELKGDGTAVDPAGGVNNLAALLRGCGLKETINAASDVTYTPQSQDADTVTVEIRNAARDTADNRRVRKIIGARGTFSLVAEKGQVVRLAFEFTGKYVEPDTDGAVAMYTNPAVTPKPLPFLSAGFTIQGFGSLLIAALNFDLGNTVSLRNDVNDATGHTMAEIVDRAPTGTVDPEFVPDTVANFFKQLTDDTEGVLQFILDGGALNKVTFNAPKAQIVNVSEADRDGLMVGNLDLRLNRSADAGDDAFSIKFE